MTMTPTATMTTKQQHRQRRQRRQRRRRRRQQRRWRRRQQRWGWIWTIFSLRCSKKINPFCFQAHQNQNQWILESDSTWSHNQQKKKTFLKGTFWMRTFTKIQSLMTSRRSWTPFRQGPAPVFEPWTVTRGELRLPSIQPHHVACFPGGQVTRVQYWSVLISLMPILSFYPF